MSNEKNLKIQRDRFLAFSFASADLFVEISEDHKIAYALGAAKGIIGVDDKSLIGRDWFELFDPIDRPVLRTMVQNAKPVMRCGPVLVTLNEEISDGKKAVVTGIKMPDSERFHLTVGKSNMMMARMGDIARNAEYSEVLSKTDFIEAAQEALSVAKSLGQDVDVTMFDFEATKDDINRFGPESWNAFTDAINELLLTKSVDGQLAGEIGPGKYSIIHDENIDANALKSQISELSKEQDPEGKGFEITAKTVSSDLSDMSERDATRALLYTIHEFERKGTELTIETLNSGLETYLESNAQKIKSFQSMIDRLSFSLYFQPIVDLQTMEASHYEMLSRFEEGDTMEWVMFGEDIGLASEFDIAVCERAINFVSFKAGNTNTKFSINISGQSIEDETFFETLKKLLDKGQNLKNRLMFEITESSHITDLEKVNKFVTNLKNEGYEIALDDFGAGSASFQYLQQLHVDHLKIDGKYTKKLLSSQRDVAMVKNLVQMCKDMDIKVIAEFVEDEAQLELLRNLEVEYGQGYLFGKPAPKPEYLPLEKYKIIGH